MDFSWFQRPEPLDTAAVEVQHAFIREKIAAVFRAWHPHSSTGAHPAWVILGTYAWTGKVGFLDVAYGFAEYFLYKLDRETAMRIVEDTLGYSLSDEKVRLIWDLDRGLESDSAAMSEAVLRDAEV
ncbi:hypothetical protein BJX63DRAFT_428529 [Aspergillus granulosus]|uniref:Uncharacterized protein n=1 Tax=Aspergillus granulosus TaxID=176169 RepID=A0ABR4HW81_9EURO